MELPVSNYVLLANANESKGYGLILKVAPLLPHINFLVIASQSDTDDAVQAAVNAHAPNIAVISRVNDMAPVYRGAHVVAVPSYRFLETFSRVCIEAHRYGKPVIGSDRANVPHLLRQSGIVLPEDVKAWAAEIQRLYAEPDYYEERCTKALENSERYSYARQRSAIGGVVRGLDSSLLVAVGSGLGNMLHVTPMIANIARRTGMRLDVVVAEDYTDSLFLMQNQQYVNSVFALRQLALSRSYDKVLVTQSFGPARVGFNSDNVLWSRDWESFHPDGMHETLFNLETAKALLGIPYTEEDTQRYYCGDIVYAPPAEPLIGMHAGSKANNWTTKRWPYFGELAARLRKQGYRVASFGTADEYIEGTENRTGGNIETMCESVAQCSHFVSNDSGLMNIANALGIPVLAIFAPTNVRTRLPLRPTSEAVVYEADCSPCEVKNPALFSKGDCRCVGRIPVDLVADRLDVMLARTGATSRAAAEEFV
jgi:ADP-heptose:LPS heptosyltransferase